MVPKRLHRASLVIARGQTIVLLVSAAVCDIAHLLCAGIDDPDLAAMAGPGVETSSK